MRTAALRKRDDAPKDSDEDQYAAQRRVRACLKCSTKFESTWYGERVCRPCKTGSSWHTAALA